MKLISKNKHKQLLQPDHFHSVGTLMGFFLRSRLFATLVLELRVPVIRGLFFFGFNLIVLLDIIIEAFTHGRWNDLTVFIPIAKHYHSYWDPEMSGWEHLSEHINSEWWAIYYRVKHFDE